MTCFRMSARSSSLPTVSACWVEITTASTRTGLPVLIVLDGDLGFAVGAEVGKVAVLADFGEPHGEFVRQRDRHRHQLRRLIAGVAEHHALVAGPAGIHAHGDIARLFVDAGNDRAGIGVESKQRVVVADGGDGAANQGLEIDVGFGGNFAGDHDQSGAVRVSQATRLVGSSARQASRMASEIWSAILSGCPSVTDSEVNRKRFFAGKLVLSSGDIERS